MTFYKTQLLTICCSAAIGTLASTAHAISSAELYTTESYPYGRFEARVQYAGGDGIVGSFFLWKDASEEEGVFWNELDVETVWADCELLTNALYGDPEMVHSESYGTAGNFCGSFHTYAYEWTPDYIAWFVDGTEIRRETGADSQAFRDNAPDGMQIHFNVWPGDSTFGGNFNPAILPVYEYINWVQYYSYTDGEFQLEWREDFGSGTLPDGWVTGDWDSPKGLSTHSPDNVAFINGYAVLSMTADDATGSAGAAPMDPEGGGPITEEEDEPAGDDDAEEMTDDAAPTDDGVNDDSAPDDDAPDTEIPSEMDPEEEPTGDDESVTDDSNAPTDSGGSGGMPSDEGTSGEGTAEMVGSGGAGGSSPAAEGAGGSGNGTAEQPVAGGQAAAPESGGSPVTGASSNTGNAATMTPSGATAAPSAAGTGPAPSTIAPMAVESDVSNDDGGCRMTGKGASNHWGWIALVFGLSLSSIRRSTRTSARKNAYRTE